MSQKEGASLILVLTAILIVIAGVFVLREPSISGFAVIEDKGTNRDKIYLTIDESQNVTWNVKNPGNINSIKASGMVSKNGTAKVYIEKDNQRYLLFDSEKPLFDVNVEVLPEYKKIYQGDELLLQIVLFNLKGFGAFDVNVAYSIKDEDGNIIAAEEEIVAVETQAKLIRKLLIPSDIKPGTYKAFVEVKSGESLIGTSSDLFEVQARYVKEHPPEYRYIAYGLGALAVLSIAVLVLVLVLKRIKKTKKAKEFKEKIPSDRIQKLEKELGALEAAFNSKFISEESYKKDKERIEKDIEKLKGK